MPVGGVSCTTRFTVPDDAEEDVVVVVDEGED
jgi:hypothetical protein